MIEGEKKNMARPTHQGELIQELENLHNIVLSNAELSNINRRQVIKIADYTSPEKDGLSTDKEREPVTVVEKLRWLSNRLKQSNRVLNESNEYLSKALG